MFDCGFTKEKHWFRYRAAAIIIEDGCVLLVGNEREDYLYSVGGGVHMGENAKDAVMREVLEETGVHYEIDRLAVIHENFFNDNNGRFNPDRDKRFWKEKFLNAIAEKPCKRAVLLHFSSCIFKNFLSLQNCFAPETA